MTRPKPCVLTLLAGAAHEPHSVRMSDPTVQNLNLTGSPSTGFSPYGQGFTKWSRDRNGATAINATIKNTGEKS